MNDLTAQNQPAESHTVAARVDIPAMPAIPPGTMSRDPHLVADIGAIHCIGWQQIKKEGPSFVVVRRQGSGTMGSINILDRFPLTDEGWGSAWAALASLDAGAAGEVLKVLAKKAAADAARLGESERQARVYESFARAGAPTAFRALGVQVLTGDDSVYTIGSHDPVTKANTSRPLGPLADAEAVVTDGSQAWSPGRAMFMPIGLAALATKSKAHAAVVFLDGTVHAVELTGSSEVRQAQLRVVQFNAIAGTSARPAAQPASDPAVKLRKLRELLDEGLICQEEYDSKRTDVINSI